jgi:tRNA nucleotidyltransferase (CCA-adding enzyme)
MQIILTHENADFDAVASLLGAAKLNPGARPVLPRHVNRNVQAFLVLYGAQLPFITQELLPRGQHIRRVILVDTQAVSSVRGMVNPLEQVTIIDHHTPPESLPPGWTFTGQRLGATTTLLVEALSARLITVTPVEATLMLAGIYEDTGALSYAGTTPRDIRAAAWLLERGGSLDIVNEFLHHPLSAGQQALYETLLDHAETLNLGGHSVLLTWAQAPLGSSEEISTLAHKLRDLLDPSAIFVLVELDGNTQLVARSTTDDINVAEIAAVFGGHGHERAAAALIKERSVAAVIAELRERLPAAVRPRVTVRDLMSHRVRTVTPETPISTIAEQMLRTGHEGFPVVDAAGHVVGLVTRNAVDRAQQHGWRLQPVRRIMEPGEVTVAPEDSAERVRAQMIQSGWGQIPVVENGQVTGVVTRTDLIRLSPPTSAEDRLISQQMEVAFPAPLLALIRSIGAEAATLRYELYFVGGIVRDLLLHHPITDVDLVVEGDAIQLAQQLARQYGGEIRTHRRFGTAKWLLPPALWEAFKADPRPPAPDRPPLAAHCPLPAFIDLVTARTEFYTEPTALPAVEWSSIKQDLHRRDFTINTLAIRLDPSRWGELLDFYGGQADLQNGVLRVLHSLSFVDDPTRILRAARFEARLGFHLDPRSEALIAEALPLLSKITGGRIRHELDLIFREAQPEAALARLGALGALKAIDPALQADGWLRTRCQRVRAQLNAAFWELDSNDQTFLRWALFLYPLEAEALHRVSRRLMLPRPYSEQLAQLPELRAALAALPSAGTPSRVVALLEELPPRLLAVGWVASDEREVQETLARYWRAWRHVHPTLTGDDLRRLGLTPGPHFKAILAALRDARLDGQIQTVEEEQALVQKMSTAEQP